ncbi:MAG: LD-carboxypeptidase [Verrucomicrobiales bacterium]|nr:LD-carboxypeptidase [Verrucomicrobiales bacterium]
MKQLIKPGCLQRGDRLAAVSLSWGGAGKFPHRFEAGKRQMEEAFGIEVVPTNNALRDEAWIAKNPKARAEDLMEAFADPQISGIVSNIGGDDSIRILPYLDEDTIRSNPKVFIGYSDTTITHLACYRAGLRTFYGPAVLSGFAENGGMFPYLENSVRKTLFEAEQIGELLPNPDGWTVEFHDWGDPSLTTKRRSLTPSAGWKFHSGNKEAVSGHLFGGCYEILDWMRGSKYWPTPGELDGAIFFIETSEEAPPPNVLQRFFRCLAMNGDLQRLKGILIGRPGGRAPANEHSEYGNIVEATLREEYEVTIPIVSGMDFGHTDPFLTIPYGAKCTINPTAEMVTIDESGVN